MAGWIHKLETRVVLFLGLAIFTFVLLLDRLFELVDLLVNKGAGILLTLKLLGLLLPTSLSLTLPMSNLLAALLTFGHLSETNEITAARASGIATAGTIGVHGSAQSGSTGARSKAMTVHTISASAPTE